MKNINPRLATIIILLAIALFGSAQPKAISQRSALAGNTYYVSPTGSDSNSGMITAPFKTIQKAATILVAGDTVNIRAGTYTEQVTPARSGSAGLYITYQAYPGETVTIDGKGKTFTWAGLMQLTGKSYIKVLGLQTINSPSFGIFGDSANNIIVQNNYTFQTVNSGIFFSNSNTIIIDSNEVELACNDGSQEMISLFNTKNFEIKNNKVHHGGVATSGGEGIDVKSGSSFGKIYGNVVYDIPKRVGIYVDGSNNIDIYDNVIYNNQSGLDIASEFGRVTENIKVYNNVIYRNNYTGSQISGCCSVSANTHPLKTISLYNNTYYGNGGPGIEIENKEFTALAISNNILSQNNNQIGLGAGIPLAQMTMDHNFFDGTSSTKGTNSISGNPQFVNAAGADFHLQSNSPACGDGAFPCGAVTPSNTPTSTNTPTRTVTPSLTPTIPAPTLTSTRTPTASFTPSPTAAATPTFTATPSPTFTPTLIPTPTSVPIDPCDPNYLPLICIYKIGN